MHRASWPIHEVRASFRESRSRQESRLAGIMRRRIRLIVTVAALIGLQGPLCAFACLTGPETEASAAQRAEAPCHPKSSDASPSEAPRSPEDCGCELANEALLPGPEVSASVATLALLPRTLGWQLHSCVHRVPTIPKDGDLPPPDVLLRKSILII